MTAHSPSDVHLVDLAVGDIIGAFFIPDYQRGYRWGRVEVEHLLNDISQSDSKRYYLQPIVVKPMDVDRWELVDGQQRLTTLFLIQQYIRREVLPTAETRFSLEYETRPGSPAYLDNPETPTSETNIDYFHIHEAATTIREWFESHGHRRVQAALDFYSALSEKVRVIWYEAPEDVDSTTLFTRLNVGRIPLTDAELVKALILSRSRAGAGRADRAQEIVAQWDAIERDLRAPEIWAFATGTDREEPTRMSLLLDTMADTRPGLDPLFHTFETLRERMEATNPDRLWNDIVDLHSLVMGWYGDRELYHKIGFLISTGASFGELVELGRNQTKSAFAGSLDDLIRNQLNLSEAALLELEYGRGRGKAEQVLLLMNVETVRRTQGSSERFSFAEYASGSWSLEHIHAQQSESLTKADQWTAWLRLHRDALGSLPDLNGAARTGLVARINTALGDISQQVFEPLERELVELFSVGEEADGASVHSITNLALLCRDDNSALNNGVFEVKRREIIKRDKEGSYIPVCTRNVFLKYYTRAEGQQIHFWGALDREGYQAELLNVVGPYLLAGEEDDA